MGKEKIKNNSSLGLINMLDKKAIDETIEIITLKVFETGCDSVNYKILKSLPVEVFKLRKTLELTKMPVYNRINELQRVGLVDFKKGTGKVESTELTKLFLTLIESIKNEVDKNLPKYLNT